MADRDIRELADLLWQGRLSPAEEPGRSTLFEVAPGMALVTAFGNSIAVKMRDGLLVVDASGRRPGPRVVEAIRSWDPSPVRTIILTHGHADHAGGLAAFDADAEARGYPRPHVIAHEKVPARMDRYARTAGYNTLINIRQFGRDVLGSGGTGGDGDRRAAMEAAWRDWRRPDQVYRDELELEIGEEKFRLRHGMGETDDHTWVWWASRRCLFPGDLFIWRTPNAGNPQKVQRYPAEWAEALREMASLGPELMVPSHSLPIFGAARIQKALDETAAVLETIVEQVLALMNRGARLDEVIHSVRVPDELLSRPYLRPLYDEPEFIVRNIWRLYGGWWDGNAANLKPAAEAALAAELASLAGGAARLAERGEELAAEGDLRLACHLVELAGLVEPTDPIVRAARAAVYEPRAQAETSLMSRGIFQAAAREHE
ncbi:MAG: alkyl sulfatase dimerization domain-containing protein [Dehalococcoidia bacterium]